MEEDNATLQITLITAKFDENFYKDPRLRIHINRTDIRLTSTSHKDGTLRHRTGTVRMTSGTTMIQLERREGRKRNCLYPCSPSSRQYKGGGGLRREIFAVGYFATGYFAWSPEFAVGNFAPTCCEPTFGWWWLLLFADALQLILIGLLFLPHEKR